MKNLLHIVILTALLIVTGCTKSNQTTPYPTSVSGRILEDGSYKPVRGAFVYLIKENGSIVSGSSTKKVIQTDTSGKFSFESDGQQALSLYVTAAGYWETPVPRLIDRPAFDIVLSPAATLAIHIVNATPYNDKDEFGLSAFDGNDGLIYGKYVDTIISDIVRGNSMHAIYWGSKKHGINKYDSAKIYCPAHQTSKVEIKY